MDIAKNFAKVTVSDGNYDADDTSIVLLSGEGAKLPTAPFNVVWWNATDYPDPSDDPGVEIVRVTAKSTDTLTVTRGQEGTSGQDHNVLAKTYKMIAGLTARTMNSELLGDVHGSAAAILVDTVTPDITVRIDGGVKFLTVGSPYIELQHSTVMIGDFEGQGNSGSLTIDDGNSKATFSNLDLGSTQAQSASGPVGTVVNKLPIYDGSGTLLGYIPIYSSIT